MAKGDDIQERLISFSVKIIELTSAMEKSIAATHVAKQILRSGTSPVPNYAEARSAESKKDFIHKLKVSLKELNETKVWLDVIARSELIPEEKISDLMRECDELCRILNASVQTSLNNRRG